MLSSTQLDGPLSPLSKKDKKNIVEQLQIADEGDLKKALIQAVLNLYRLPTPLRSKFDSLQQSYQEHQTIPVVKSHLENAIKAYIEAEGFHYFQSYLKEPFAEEHWDSPLLSFLANELKLRFEQEPVVEAFIRNGKVYWRVVKDNQVIDDRHSHEQNFDQATTWRMNWEQFRLFKDSGKRSGTVVITKERFVNYFGRVHQYQAGFVWEELKEKGILNSKNRLSDGWRAASEDKVKLSSLINTEYFITENRVRDLVMELRENDKNTIISRETFVDRWPQKFKLNAGLIWGGLKEQGTLNEENQILKLKYSVVDILNGLKLSYEMVVKAIYAIANNSNNKENVDSIPDATIFRAERDKKQWAHTSTVGNNEPKHEKNCTKLWDVSVYQNLQHHRNTNDELQKNGNNKLNYDHVPSADALKSKAVSVHNENVQLIGDYQKQKEKLKKEISQRETELAELMQPRFTRHQLQMNPDAQLEELKKEYNATKVALDNILRVEKQIVDETKRHGEYWWTVAIPEKLHKQGETFMQSKTDQNKSDQHPFLKDISAYLYMLETRPADFSLSLDDYLRALGAFRYLYHCQVKTPDQIKDRYTLGIIPQTLFSQTNVKQEIDKLFNKGVKTFLEKREGMKPA